MKGFSIHHSFEIYMSWFDLIFSILYQDTENKMNLFVILSDFIHVQDLYWFTHIKFEKSFVI